MRVIRFLLIASLPIFSYGCSKEQSYEKEKQAVSLWPKETLHINTKVNLAHSNHTLISDNQEIATAYPDDNETGAYIIAHKSGDTMIRLVDTNDNKTLCEIYVHVIYFGSPEIIDWGFSLEGYSGIIVKAKNIEIQKKIEDELLAEHKLLIGATYTFNSKTKKFTMKTNSGISFKGTYDWDITSLTLIYDNKIEKYGFKFAVGMRYGYIIQTDRTNNYQQKYPNANITEVRVNRIWKDNGIAIVGGVTF